MPSIPGQTDFKLILKCFNKNGNKKIPAKEILNAATCSLEKANIPFFIRIKLLPQTNDKTSKMSQDLILIFCIREGAKVITLVPR